MVRCIMVRFTGRVEKSNVNGVYVIFSQGCFWAATGLLADYSLSQSMQLFSAVKLFTGCLLDL